jgi:hypothetical protein
MENSDIDVRNVAGFPFVNMEDGVVIVQNATGFLFVNISVEGQCVKTVAEVPFANTVVEGQCVKTVAEVPFANTDVSVISVKSVVGRQYANTKNSAVLVENVSGKNGSRNSFFVKANGVRYTRTGNTKAIAERVSCVLIQTNRFAETTRSRNNMSLIVSKRGFRSSRGCATSDTTLRRQTARLGGVRICTVISEHTY